MTGFDIKVTNSFQTTQIVLFVIGAIINVLIILFLFFAIRTHRDRKS